MRSNDWLSALQKQNGDDMTYEALKLDNLLVMYNSEILHKRVTAGIKEGQTVEGCVAKYMAKSLIGAFYASKDPALRHEGHHTQEYVHAFNQLGNSHGRQYIERQSFLDTLKAEVKRRTPEKDTSEVMLLGRRLLAEFNENINLDYFHPRKKYSADNFADRKLSKKVNWAESIVDEKGVVRTRC